MVRAGKPRVQTVKKVVLYGSGKLGKELVMELQRYGVAAPDKYENTPAMWWSAHRPYIVSMLEGTIPSQPHDGKMGIR